LAYTQAAGSSVLPEPELELELELGLSPESQAQEQAAIINQLTA